MPNCYHSEAEYQAAVEAEARRIWQERQKGWPKFVQQRFEQGTALAQLRTVEMAIENLRK